MSRKAVYPTPWLDARFPFDTQARNQALEAKCLAHLPQDRRVNLLDLGAGNGANTRYFLDRIPQSQDWILIEHDPLLNEAALQQLGEYGEQLGYQAERNGQVLQLEKGDKTVRIELQQQSLLEESAICRFVGRDLIMANAVFDLFAEDQFRQLMKSILLRGIPFYTTLNYESMRFLPAEPSDEGIIGLYDSHMQRPQAFGQAMGTEGPTRMVACLEELGGQVETAPSHWHIGAEETVMQDFLLGFMAEAIPELDLSAAQSEQFAAWLQKKHFLRANHTLQISVSHQDILAFPS